MAAKANQHDSGKNPFSHTTTAALKDWQALTAFFVD
jgi:hypothetical protein